jgi:hypothetical protein
MIIISEYQLEKIETNRYRVDSFEISICPVCGDVVIVIGTRERGYIDGSGEKQTLIIRRLRCKGCRLIHHELPDIIVPYKRHCTKTIEMIVTGEDDAVPCEDNTIRRIKWWFASSSLYFENILASLREKYGAVFSLKPALKEIVRAVVNAHLWPHTRSVFTPG